MRIIYKFSSSSKCRQQENVSKTNLAQFSQNLENDDLNETDDENNTRNEFHTNSSFKLSNLYSRASLERGLAVRFATDAGLVSHIYIPSR